MVNGAGGALLECWMGCSWNAALGMLEGCSWSALGTGGVLLQDFWRGFLEGVVFEGFCGFRMREVSGTRSGSGAYQKASGFGMEQQPE